jgi:hypothetical protein
MGNAATATSGGHIKLTGSAKLTLGPTANAVWRWVTSNDSLSTWYITDDAKVTYKGDGFNSFSGLVETGDIYTDEGRRIAVFYNETDTLTTVYSVSETAFNVADKSEVIVGVKKPTRELLVKNTTGIVSWEWKYAAAGTAYKTFDPAQTGATLVASFDSAGTYYIIAEGFDGTSKIASEMIKVTVVGVVVSPDTPQTIAALTDGTPLTVAESVTVDSREWKSSTKSGSGYEAVFPPVNGTSYTPMFMENGIYYVVCESIYKGVPIISNEVMIDVGGLGIADLEQGSFTLFPNPARGSFYINESSHSFNLSVIDLNGRVALERKFDNVTGNQLIGFNGRGFYLVRITTEKGTTTRPVIME